VPARVEYVSLLRMVVSTYAATHSDLDDERLDDLRLAVSEACTLVVRAARSTDTVLVVTCTDVPDGLLLDVHDGGGTELSEPDEAGELSPPDQLDRDGNLPLELIRALVDEVERGDDNGRASLRLTIHCSSRAA